MTTGRVVRFALLACTLVGLAAMHSLGHDAAMRVAATAAHAMHAESAMSPAAVANDECSGDGCGRLLAAPADRDHGHVPGWAVCLAVVGSFAVAVVLGVLLSAGRASGQPGRRRAGRTTSSRGPPVGMVGLRLATVSVLRI
ncbi:DUF6153 family protein [Micromonospora sp. DT47]|uniref:DUF6153 family protein n=1 Tax=Micromonospora sp. DT47 TaxID=3393431 RepID=UPI003CF6E465